MPVWSGSGEVIWGSACCPLCGADLEYNGNYWCSGEECEYTMGDLGETEGVPFEEVMRDRKAFNRAYVMLMRQRGEPPRKNALMPEVEY
jgi:hypothetical protein